MCSYSFLRVLGVFLRKRRVTKNNDNFSLFFHVWSQVIVFRVFSVLFFYFPCEEKKYLFRFSESFLFFVEFKKFFFCPREYFCLYVWSKVTWTWCEDGDFFFSRRINSRLQVEVLKTSVFTFLISRAVWSRFMSCWLLLR